MKFKRLTLTNNSQPYQLAFPNLKLTDGDKKALYNRYVEEMKQPVVNHTQSEKDYLKAREFYEKQVGDNSTTGEGDSIKDACIHLMKNYAHFVLTGKDKY